MTIVDGGLDDARVVALLEHHVRAARVQTGRGSAHALGVDALRAPDIRFWSAWDGDEVVGVGALRRLSPSHGEIKSMYTAESHRRRGVASAMLQHLLDEACRMGLSRVSLETGSWPYFNPARALYRRSGFVECPAFGEYVPDVNSIFMTRTLD